MGFDFHCDVRAHDYVKKSLGLKSSTTRSDRRLRNQLWSSAIARRATARAWPNWIELGQWTLIVAPGRQWHSAHPLRTRLDHRLPEVASAAWTPTGDPADRRNWGHVGWCRNRRRRTRQEGSAGGSTGIRRLPALRQQGAGAFALHPIALIMSITASVQARAFSWNLEGHSAPASPSPAPADRQSRASTRPCSCDRHR